MPGTTPTPERRSRLAPNFFGDVVNSAETKNIERDDLLHQMHKLSDEAEALSKAMMEDNLNYLASNTEWDRIVKVWNVLKMMVVDFIEAASTIPDDKTRVDIAVQELGTELAILHEEVKTNETTQRLLNIQIVAGRNSERAESVTGSQPLKVRKVMYTPAPPIMSTLTSTPADTYNTLSHIEPKIERRRLSSASSHKSKASSHKSKTSSHHTKSSQGSTASAAAIARAESNKAKLKLEQVKRELQLEEEISTQNRKLTILKLENEIELQESFAKELEEVEELSVFEDDIEDDAQLPSFEDAKFQSFAIKNPEHPSLPGFITSPYIRPNVTPALDVTPESTYVQPQESLHNPSQPQESLHHPSHQTVKVDDHFESHIHHPNETGTATDPHQPNQQIFTIHDNTPRSRSVGQDRTAKLIYLNTIEPVKFNGSPRDFPEFKKRVKMTLDDGTLSEAEQVEMLPKFLDGEPLIMLKRLQGRSYQSILDRLEDRFGHPNLVANSYMAELISGPNIQAHDRKGLQEFADLLTTAAESLEGAYFANASCAPNMSKMADRLPNYMKNEWEKKVVDLCARKQAPDIGDIATFVDKGARAKNNPFYQATIDSRRPSLKVMAAGLDMEEEEETSIEAMEDRDKFQAMKRRGLCYICAKKNCIAKTCPSQRDAKVACQECERPHSMLLPCRRRSKLTKNDNQRSAPKPIVTPESEARAPVISWAVNLGQEPELEYMLTLMPVRIHGKNNRSITTYAFPDGGSKGSFLDEGIAEYLGLTAGAVSVRKVHTIIGTQPQRLRYETFEVSNIITGERTLVKHQSFVMLGTDLSKKLSEKHLPEEVDIEKFAHLKNLNIPRVEKKIIGVMLGLPVAEAHDAIRYYRGKPDEPFAIKTKLGTSLAGPIGHTNAETLLGVNVTQVLPTETEDPMMERLLERLWKLDDYATSDPKFSLSKADQKAIEMFESSIHQRKDHHYQSGLLWKKPNVTLPYNRPMAVMRLLSLLKRLKRDPGFATMYCKSMREYIINGWASILTDEELKRRHPRISYLPHFGVTNPNKPGKVRSVFDGGAEYENTSLNNNLMSGPDSSCSLIGVFLRARVAIICVSGDVRAMFNMCYVSPEDRDALRFLWFDEEGKIRDYKMNIHVFGKADSPFAANRILKKIALDNEDQFDESIIKIVLRNFYVDDTMFNSRSTSEAVRLAIGVKELLKRGGMDLTKFSSNSKEVLKALEQKDLANQEINIDLDPLPVERALGLRWNTESDTLGFKITNLDTANTLRGATSHVARVFDPLGITAPVMLAGKRMIQELWKRKMKWDDPMPNDMLNSWLKWKNTLHCLERLEIPRRFFPQLKDCRTDLRRLEFHLFADSSGYATGAAVYLRGIDSDGKIHVSNLVFGKSKLLPIKPKLYTPRNEMKAAVDIVRISQKLESELDLDIDDRVFWTDSEIVLAYIKNETKTFHAFIANRQSEIRMYTTSSQWRHCRSHINVSDDPSRGIKAEDFNAQHRYIIGPGFLAKPEAEWPTTHIRKILDDDPEVKMTMVSIFSTSIEKENDNNLILKLTNKKSSFTYLCHIIGWMYRWKEAVSKVPPRLGVLSRGEVTQAENALVAITQRQFFTEEIATLQAQRHVKNSPILDLHPFLDDNGIIRAKGRLQNAPNIAYTTKHPVILPSPSKCHLSKIIIDHYHSKLAHGGQELMMGCVQEKFWIVGARSYIRKVIRRCLLCRKRTAKAGEQIMADLPSDRLLAFHPAFSVTGTDCFGPITCKDKRRTVSLYGVIFLCLTTKAIHLEAVVSLDTKDFILALMRFVALRGRVDRIRSDNGSNYVGAERSLRELVRNWNEKQIIDTMTVRGVDWKFQAPFASSMSGIWERRVKETKRHLYAILRNSQPTTDVFRTLLYEVANIMNQAPLCPVSNDPLSYEVLTPAHFLFQRSAFTVAPVPAEEWEGYRKQWRMVQYLADCYWHRWQKEYMPTLLPRSKWLTTKRNLQVDDLVMITNTNLPRSRWLFGRIVETFPGKDGYVRHARVKTKDSEYLRPVQRLAIVAERE